MLPTAAAAIRKRPQVSAVVPAMAMRLAVPMDLYFLITPVIMTVIPLQNMQLRRVPCVMSVSGHWAVPVQGQITAEDPPILRLSGIISRILWVLCKQALLPLMESKERRQQQIAIIIPQLAVAVRPVSAYKVLGRVLYA